MAIPTVLSPISLLANTSKLIPSTKLVASNRPADKAVSSLSNMTNKLNGINPGADLYALNNAITTKTLAVTSGVTSLVNRLSDSAEALGLIGNQHAVEVLRWDDSKVDQIYKTLQNSIARPDPHMLNRWVAYIVDPTSIYEEPGAAGATPPKIEHYIDEITTPSFSVAPDHVYREGKNHTYAGNVSIENIDLGFYPDCDSFTANFVDSWCGLAYNRRTNTFNVPSKYKKTIVIELLDPANQPSLIVKLYGCFPLSRASIGLNSTSDFATIRLNVSVDDVEFIYEHTSNYRSRPKLVDLSKQGFGANLLDSATSAFSKIANRF